MKYANVPKYILSYSKLNMTERLLMGIIISLCTMSGECFASNEYFSRILCVSIRTISSSLSSLKNENLIKMNIKDGSRKIYLTDKLKNNIE